MTSITFRSAATCSRSRIRQTRECLRQEHCNVLELARRCERVSEGAAAGDRRWPATRGDSRPRSAAPRSLTRPRAADAGRRRRLPELLDCGIPYWLSGEVTDRRNLAHRTRRGPRARRPSPAARYRRAANRRRAPNGRANADGREESLGYDRLVIATGRRPARPPVPGDRRPRSARVAFDRRRSRRAGALDAGARSAGGDRRRGLHRRRDGRRADPTGSGRVGHRASPKRGHDR